MTQPQKPNFFIKLAESVWGMSYAYLSKPEFKRVRKILVFLVGFTVLLIGIAMIVLPGPALVFVPLGLAILGTEYLWARKLLNKLKRQAQHVKDKVATFRQKKV